VKKIGTIFILLLTICFLGMVIFQLRRLSSSPSKPLKFHRVLSEKVSYQVVGQPMVTTGPGPAVWVFLGCEFKKYASKITLERYAFFEVQELFFVQTSVTVEKADTEQFSAEGQKLRSKIRMRQTGEQQVFLHVPPGAEIEIFAELSNLVTNSEMVGETLSMADASLQELGEELACDDGEEKVQRIIDGLNSQSLDEWRAATGIRPMSDRAARALEKFKESRP